MIAKSMRPDNPNNEKEILWLILLGNTPSNPRTRKLTPRIITSHRPICSIVLDEYFKLGVVITSLICLKPNNRNNCLSNTPAEIVTIPRINQKGNILLFPILLVLVRPTTGYTANSPYNKSVQYLILTLACHKGRLSQTNGYGRYSRTDTSMAIVYGLYPNGLRTRLVGRAG